MEYFQYFWRDESQERHTSEHIAEMLQKMCTEWSLRTAKVSAVVKDNAENMVKSPA